MLTFSENTFSTEYTLALISGGFSGGFKGVVFFNEDGGDPINKNKSDFKDPIPKNSKFETHL